MANCTFFGHRDCPETIKPKLRAVLLDLITNYDVDMFYVGHQGQFDAYVHSELKKIKHEYPQISYTVVLSYMPGKKADYDDYLDTMLPEGIETVHPRYAISWCNKWMLDRSDYVVTDITHTWGEAYQYAQKAKCQNKRVINVDMVLV